MLPAQKASKTQLFRPYQEGILYPKLKKVKINLQYGERYRQAPELFNFVKGAVDQSQA